MKLTAKILFRFFGLLLGCAPLATSAVVPPPPPLGDIYVGNYQDPSIDVISPSGNSSLFAYMGYYPAAALAFNNSGSLFAVSDSGIYEYDSHGNSTLFAGLGLNNPNAMAFDANGNLYVANLGSGAGQGYIEKYNSQGVGSLFADTGTIQPSGGLAFDNNGNLYAALEGGSTIEEYNSQGAGTPFAGGIQAYSITFYNGYLYVATPGVGPGANDIYKIDSQGNKTLFANTDISAATALAFSGGYLYAENENNNTIAVFDSQGNGSIFASESYLINSMAIAPVPEPSTWTMLVLAAGVIFVTRRLVSPRAV